MNEREFLNVTKEEIAKRLDEGVEIRLQSVRKNNNVVLQGLTIQKPGNNIAPTIYLNAFYEMYKQGMSMEEILTRIMNAYKQGEVKNNIDMEFFRDFSLVKGRIVYRLIHAGKNQELLQEIPHILFLDLAICFYYSFYNDDLGEGMILIHNNHMEMWKTGHRELMKLAQENTPKLFKPIFVTLDTLVESCSIRGEADPVPAEFYVLTNEQKTHGAACLLYEGMMDRIAEKMQGSFYMIPCSIHEVILFKDNGVEDIGYLQMIIQETNCSQLSAEEILSDHPYYYNSTEKKLMEKKVF